MAAAFDGTANVTGSATAATTLTITGKTTAGTNRYGVVAVTWNSGTPTVSSATWNGVAMTIIDQGNETVNAGLGSALLGIINPPTAASDIVVTFSVVATGSATASSYNGVDQTTPISASNKVITTTAQAATNTVTTATGEVIVDSLSWTKFDGSEVFTVDAGQTEIANVTYGVFYKELSSYQDGASGGVMSWSSTPSGGGYYCSIAASLKASASGPVIPLMGQRFYVNG